MELITKWFTIMNVKEKFKYIKLRYPDRQPWTRESASFVQLNKACVLVGDCAWEGTGKRQLKLTKQTAETFTVIANACVEAANILMLEREFSYVLPGIFSDDSLEKFFGQARQSQGGNFYIDACDVMASAKVANLSTLIKHEVMPQCDAQPNECDNKCDIYDHPGDISELLDSVTWPPCCL